MQADEITDEKMALCLFTTAEPKLISINGILIVYAKLILLGYFK